MEFWQAVVLAIIEGVTEYLPVSSTGHMILASSAMGVNENAFVKDYLIIVQFGAILAVVALYFQRFRSASVSFYTKLGFAFVPAGVVGFLLKKKIDALLESPLVVAFALIAGGVAMIVADRWLEKRVSEGGSITDMTYAQSALIGAAQCAALVPGVSRSAATILGGLWQRLSRREAAEFSFFLAVPTLTAATAYKALKIAPSIRSEDTVILLVGNLIAFVVAMLAIRFFIELVSRKGFAWFGVYRIALGVATLAWLSR